MKKNLTCKRKEMKQIAQSVYFGGGIKWEKEARLTWLI
jgi:hypothetical protein